MEKNIKTQLVFKFKTFAEKNLINTLLITINTTAILCNIAMMGKKKNLLWSENHFGLMIIITRDLKLPSIMYFHMFPISGGCATLVR